MVVSPKTFALALHSTTAELGLSLSALEENSDNREWSSYRFQVWDVGRSMSTHLHEYLNQFLQPQSWRDLAFIAVANGPGSFTSTRIGVVTARTLAQQLNVPLFSISSLAALAAHSLQHSPQAIAPPDLAVQLPAQREEIYTAIYRPQFHTSRFTLEPAFPDQLLTPEQWQQVLASWPHSYQLIQSDSLGKTVTGVLDLAIAAWEKGGRPDWSEALPFYGQSPV